jgi:hypothetical protein
VRPQDVGRHLSFHCAPLRKDGTRGEKQQHFGADKIEGGKQTSCGWLLLLEIVFAFVESSDCSGCKERLLSKWVTRHSICAPKDQLVVVDTILSFLTGTVRHDCRREYIQS